MNVLVTGGAGYIGSHTAKLLKQAGHKAVIVDNLSRGHKQAIPDLIFHWADIRDQAALVDILNSESIEAVIHFAALSQVGQSMSHPDLYYQWNVLGTLTLLQAMHIANVKHLVFSSSAAVYGEPEQIPIQEDMALSPSNPYGETKRVMESAMHWYAQSDYLNYVALRYFNAAGADPHGELGEDHHPETHIIPIILQVALGQRDHVDIFGNNYATPDGTCIRDYIHVWDLAQAHVDALHYLVNGGSSTSVNLGNGQGFSVQQVVEIARTITEHDIPTQVTPRRIGDPTSLVASSEKAKQLLNWIPQYPKLETIIETAWQWHKKHPYGYSEQG